MSLWRKAYLITLTLVDAYSSLIYVHILSALTFMLTHGVTASAILFVRNGTNAERIRLLLQIARNRSVVGVTNTSITVLLLTGITLGFLGGWWGRDVDMDRAWYRGGDYFCDGFSGKTVF